MEPEESRPNRAIDAGDISRDSRRSNSAQPFRDIVVVFPMNA
jgi:hypothetical protein